MTSDRRQSARLTPERRTEPQPQWKGKPILWPLAAALLALAQLSGGETSGTTDRGQAVTVSLRGGAMADCWYDPRDKRYPDIKVMDWLCAVHTVNRR